MKYLNLDLSFNRSVEFQTATPEQQAAWLCIMAYCADQENGGEILMCQKWDEGTWQRVIGCSKAVVDAKSRLWNWNGDCLRVLFYPHEQEKSIIRKRVYAMKGSERRWEKQQEGKIINLPKPKRAPK